ncbi:MAG: HAMP domain-containing sensor histidine kinase [Geothermobacteraceae bacterium]
MASDAPRQRLAPTPRLHQEGPTILIVDDEPVLRQLCARALEGFRILEAENGRMALDILAGEAVDVVLSDIMMPEMTGLELLAHIRQSDPDQVVVMMTGYGERDVIIEALKLDADDFLTKPVNLLQLTTIVRRALEKKALREQLLQLKKLDRLKTEFLELVSHKLKTPVTVVSLFLQNLERDLEGSGLEVYRDSLPRVQGQLDYLTGLIEDLLFYSDRGLDPGALKTEAIDPAGLTRNISKELAPKAEAKGLAFALDLQPADPPVLADPKRLRYCVSALIDNAIKFTSEGGRVEITGKTVQGRYALAVRDNGPGIPLDLHKKVFDKFFQVDPMRTGQVPGFGLGLFYVREFCRSMHVEVLLDSAEGKGATITLLLPQAEQSG